MNYPANQVLAMLRMYDALPNSPHFLDVAILPTIKAEVEAYLSTARDWQRVEIVHRFQNSLISQYRDLVVRNDLWHVQNLECEISRDFNKVSLTWAHPFVGTRRFLEFDVTSRTEAAADVLLTASINRLKEITLYIRDYDRNNGAT